ncbi:MULTISPECIES: alpha/beta fold hydrolase [unclassified Sporolactobacillus]|uniref:alpha/beta fold hydrolase n=1 Tax=unclassified Sporolactobacillus TaxID=2628533 RepID=UPI002368B213|nr:alpha/beta hydrolase [Sporolactobacillus sp. CQH2019]MDD9149778.1 alpha/beta hydrolase [Sporolactobacillus sp. CQH2019]
MSYFLTDDNAKIFYTDEGTGKPIVLIHGWSCHHEHFNKVTPELKKKYRIITYDLRGHGRSEVPDDGYTIDRYSQDLKNLLDYLNLNNVTLVGWSMGTHIIFDYIKQFDCNKLDKIVFIDMSPKLITDDKWTKGLYGKYSTEDNFNVLVAMNENWHAFSDGFIRAIFAKSGVRDQEDYTWCLEEAYKNSPNVMVRMWISMTSKDYRDVLPKITVPTLITYGAESCLYNADNSQFLKESINSAETFAFPKCGHALFREEPELFVNVLSKFVD